MGDYTIKEKLGEGAMGQVYRAFQASLRRTVALKTMGLEAAKSPDNVERFYREASILCQLSHPHVVPVYDTGTLGSLPFFVMELIEGTSLAQLIQDEGPLPFPRALRLTHQLADALSYLHERGIYHRDIKPQNLVFKGLNERDHLVVVDFGLARSATSRSITLEGESVGTLQYMSPETIESGESGGPQDIWALALVSQFLLTGIKPFAGGDLRQVALKIYKFDPALHAKKMGDVAPSWMKDLLVACWTKKPEERPTATEIVELLEAEASKLSIEGFLLEREASRRKKIPETTPAIPPPTLVRKAGPTGRRPAALAAAGLTIAAVSAIGAWALLRDRGMTSVTGFSSPPAGVPGGLILGTSPVTLTGPIQIPPPAPEQNPVSILQDFTVLPADQSATIGFTMTTRGEATVQIGTWSDRRVKESWRHPPGSLYFYHVVRGLQDSTHHFVRVVGDSGENLVRDYRFTTLPPSHREKVETWIRKPSGSFLPDELLASPVPEMIQTAIRRLGKDPAPQHLVKVSLLAARLKDQELSQALLPFLERGTTDAVLAQLAESGTTQKSDEVPALFRASTDEAMMDLEHLLASLVNGVATGRIPEVLQLARRLVPVARREPTLAACARAFVPAGSPDDVDRVAARLGALQMICSPAIREALILCNRQRAREVFVDWQKRQIFESAQYSGIQGLGALGEPADFEIVKGVMLGLGEIVAGIPDPELPSGDVAAITLADLGTAGAIGVLGTALAERPDNTALLWSCARRGVSSTADRALALLSQNRRQSLHADAAMAFGLSGGAGTPKTEALRLLLDNPDPRVRDAAAWSIARLGDRASEPALTTLAESERDERGVALWALGRVGTEKADAVILRLLSQLASSRRATDRSRLALACWAAVERRIAGAIDILWKLDGSSKAGTLVNEAARLGLEVLTGNLTGAGPGDLPHIHVLLPLGWYDRTGIRLARGGSVDLTVRGGWGFGPLDSPEGPSTEVIGTSRAPGFVLGATAILGGDHTALGPGKTRLLARREEELVLSPFRTVRPEVSVSRFPEPWGVAWVMIEP